jgi:hypothetical protein
LTALAIGIAVFAVGFRLTSEVIPILGALFVIAALLGSLPKYRPWLWGLGIGLGTRVVSVLHLEPPLSPEHVTKYGNARPLPLPFGWTDSVIAQAVAGSLIIMLFPFVGSCLGWAGRWTLQRVDRLGG